MIRVFVEDNTPDPWPLLDPDSLGLTTADLAEEAWDERSLLEEEARYEARRVWD